MRYGERQFVRLEKRIELLRELEAVVDAMQPVDVALLATIRELLRDTEAAFGSERAE
jgi:hypothetical protein